MKEHIRQFMRKRERGQAIILIVFAMIGLVSMVGLVIDTGILFIEYGKLKRGVDAASIAAAQQFRPLASGFLDQVAMENAARNFLQLNQSDITSITVHSCEDVVVADRPDLCNPDPVGNPMDNRKLVEVTASKNVEYAFLKVLGIRSGTITANSVGEAAAVDLVLVVDTSASMAYETGGSDPGRSDPTDDPTTCNAAGNCEPMQAIKLVALDFLDTLYFPYDRVSVIAMTSQVPDGQRTPVQVLPLTSDKATVQAVVSGLKVFEPRTCDGTSTPGVCKLYDGFGNFLNGAYCEIYEKAIDANPAFLGETAAQIQARRAAADPSSCPSSNIGGSLRLAGEAFTEAGLVRLDSFWVVVTLVGGPANATDSTVTYPNGFCPENTWVLFSPWCRDRLPTSRHADSDTASYTNPISNEIKTVSIYDAEDYARDRADELATLITEGVTIYTIGLGDLVRSTSTSDEFYPDGVTKIPPAEHLLEYIARDAGGPDINHGQYFYAPDRFALFDIFEQIANNIATRISQ